MSKIATRVMSIEEILTHKEWTDSDKLLALKGREAYLSGKPVKGPSEVHFKMVAHAHNKEGVEYGRNVVLRTPTGNISFSFSKDLLGVAEGQEVDVNVKVLKVKTPA